MVNSLPHPCTYARSPALFCSLGWPAESCVPLPSPGRLEPGQGGIFYWDQRGENIRISTRAPVLAAQAQNTLRAERGSRLARAGRWVVITLRGEIVRITNRKASSFKVQVSLIKRRYEYSMLWRQRVAWNIQEGRGSDIFWWVGTLLTRLPASQAAECCVAGAVCVLYFNEGKGGIDCGPGGSDTY